MEPLLEQATEVQSRKESRGTHVTPASLLVYRWPVDAAAITLIPSSDDATPTQFRYDGDGMGGEADVGGGVG